MTERRSLHLFRTSLALFAAAGLLVLASPAGAQILLTATSASFSWQPAPGGVDFYEVWVSRSTRGGGFALEQTLTGANSSAVITAEVGEVLRVRVRAGNDKVYGPMSPPSDTVRFGLPPEYPVLGAPGVVQGRTAGAKTTSVYFADESTGVTWRYTETESEQPPTQIGQEADDRWKLVASGDFDGDGQEDLYWVHENGATRIWYLDGDTHQEELCTTSPGADWVAELTSDFDGNGQDDLFWRDPAGPTVVWLRASVDFAPFYFPPMPGETWELLTAGDFNGDGFDDLFWRDRGSVETSVWFMEADPEYGLYARTGSSNERAMSWEVAETRDEDGDGMEDILWRQVGSEDRVEWWHMDGENVRPPQLASAQ